MKAARIVLVKLWLALAPRQVFLAENETHLTPIEFKLLATLAIHAGKVLTYRQLLKDVWGQTSSQESRTLRIQLRICATSFRPTRRGRAVCTLHQGWVTACEMTETTRLYPKTLSAI